MRYASLQLTLLHIIDVFHFFLKSERTQETDPRSEWRALQEEMLRSYLASAKNDLKAKQELIDVKHQRLSLAQDEYHNLNNTLSNLSASSTSCKNFFFLSLNFRYSEKAAKIWPIFHSSFGNTKGQLISKGNFSVFNSPKKTNLKMLIFLP